MATSSATVAMAGISSPSLHPSPASPSKFVSLKPSCLPAIRSSLQQQQQPLSEQSPASRRALLGLLFASAPAALLAQDALAAASSIKVEGPPPPSGGLPGTQNADQASDTDLPLKERFYLQKLPPAEAAARAKDSAKDIVGVKALIDKKAWPYVQNDLRLKASYLRYDLNTVIDSKNKDEKKAIKSLVSKLFDTISNLDYAARNKSVPQAEKYYAETVTALNNVLAKIA